MSFQQFANSVNPATTLSGNGGSITDVAATLIVASVANLPTNPNFTIGVSTGGTIEWMLVTGISGTTLTVTRHQEGSSAASHNDGDNVYLILTAGALTQILQDTCNVGTFASRPTSATGARTGMTYRCYDAPYELIYDGSAWQYRIPGIEGWLTLPPTSSWSWDNQGSGTFDTTFGYLLFAAPSTGAVTCRGIYRTSPATSWSMAFLFDDDLSGGITNTGAEGAIAIGFRQSSTGKLVVLNVGFGYGGAFYAEVQNWNSATSNSAIAGTTNHSVATIGHWVNRRPKSIKIQDDGTNLKFYFSIDNGNNWRQEQSISRTAFLSTSGGVTGPDQIFVGLYANSIAGRLKVLSMIQGT